MVAAPSDGEPPRPATGHTRPWTIGFLSPVVHGFYFGNLLTGVVDVAARRGCHVIAIQSIDAGLDLDTFPDGHAAPQTAWLHIDGFVVVLGAVSDAYLHELARTGKPVVAVCREIVDFPCPTVLPDNRGGIDALLDHLVEHGHTRIAYAGRSPADIDGEQRYQAYRDGMLARGLLPDEPVLVPWLGTVPDPSVGTQRLLTAQPRPTAVIACTDMAAMAVIEALTEAGLSVPEDMAVVGFDDLEDAASCEPPLTTIAQSFTLTGAVAGDLALAALDGYPAEPGYHHVPVSLVKRESCGCDPRADAPSGDPGAVRERFTTDLVEVVDGWHGMTRSAREELRALGDRIFQLYATTAGQPRPGPTVGPSGPGPAVEPSVGPSVGPSGPEAAADLACQVRAVTSALHQYVTEMSTLPPVIVLLRRLAKTMAAWPEHGGDSTRLNCLVSDLTVALAENLCYLLRTRPGEYRHFEDQRQRYKISTDLVRRYNRDARSLSWLAATDVEAGCLALWEGGRNSGQETHTLRIVGAYDKYGTGHVVGERCDVRAFPPVTLVDMLNGRPGNVIYLLSVRFDGSDWGFLALAGPLSTAAESALEIYNQWAALLTVALDQEQAMHSEHALLEEIRLSEERYALAAEAANDGLWDWDVISGTTYYSGRWKSQLGYTDNEITATPEAWLSRIHRDDRPGVDELIAEHFGGGATTLDLEYRMRAADGTYRWVLTRARTVRDEGGRVTRLVASMTDITDRRNLEERLRQDASYDGLTGLPNRTLFLHRLNQAIDAARSRSGRPFAVIFLDLDGFKIINDSLGHQAGDQVLVRVAERLAGEMRAGDTVARFGGDEFVLLIADVQRVRDVCATADRVLAAISEPLLLGDRSLVVSAAAGIAVSRTGYRTADEFVRDADTAMYRAKALGGGAKVVFDESMHAAAMARLQLESDLREALAENQFELHHQPILTLADRHPVGTEALIRWRHPARGLVPPDDFLPLAESTGLVRQLSRLTIRQACRQIRTWRQDGYPDGALSVSVNLSNRQFWDPQLRSHLRQALVDFDVPPSAVVFEVTEGVIMHNQDAARELMGRLRGDGIRLYVDDFGTGYSSLAMLNTFPVDALKIDRSFTSRITADARARELVHTMITMGLNLGLAVVAEGIETEEQAALLTELGCPLGQGYLFSRPVASADLSRLLATWPPPVDSRDAAVAHAHRSQAA